MTLGKYNEICILHKPVKLIRIKSPPLLLALIGVLIFMINPLKKSAKYEIVKTLDFSCPSLVGFTFKYPVFKGLEIKKMDGSEESVCNIFLNEPLLDINKVLSSREVIPPTPAPRFQVTKRNIPELSTADTKNAQGVFYKLVQVTGDPLYEYILFFEKDAVVSIDLFGIDERFAFSKDVFWKTIIDSFKLA